MHVVNGIVSHRLLLQANAAAVEAKVDWAGLAKELDSKSPLEIMDKVCFLGRQQSKTSTNNWQQLFLRAKLCMLQFSVTAQDY